MNSLSVVVALGAFLVAGNLGCSGGVPPQVANAAGQALCVKVAAEQFDALNHPELLDATEALALAAQVRACFAKPAPAADAGVK